MKATKKPVVRTCRWIQRPTRSEAGVVALTIDGKAQRYHFTPIPCEFEGCTAVEWGKGPDDEPYHVLVGNGGVCQCDCRGFMAYDRCKHSSATIALLASLKKGV